MNIKELVTFESYVSMDIRFGTIRAVFPVEGSEKLLRCLVDFGPELATEEYTNAEGEIVPVRQILSGIRTYFPEFQELVGQQALYIVNLPPRDMMGYTSHGMLLAAGENDCVLVQPQKPVEPGSALH
jgi:methionyl-tRNA synthetase